MIPARLAALLAAFAVALGLAGTATAQTPTDRPPNLKALPASNFSLVTDTSDNLLLRFATTSWNAGNGPLQLEAGSVDTGSGKQQVNQRVWLSDGSTYLHLAGWFEWHPTHNHFHFDNYALYTLQPINAPGGSSRTGQKTTFCVMDTTKISGSLPGAPLNAVYSTCGNQIQGMSIGWGDTYGAHLPGQEIDISDNPDGIYQLIIDVDPMNLLIESSKGDNRSCVLLDIRRPGTVTVLDASGTCSTVSSVTPNSGSMGTTIQITIFGYGFSDGVAVSFEGGTGPRPVASNVRLASNTATVDTLTATVTIPFKRNLGRNPVWDLRVGSGGLLPKAFTVTR